MGARVESRRGGGGGRGRLDSVREQAGLGVLLAVLVKPARVGELGLRAGAGTCTFSRAHNGFRDWPVLTPVQRFCSPSACSRAALLLPQRFLPQRLCSTSPRSRCGSKSAAGVSAAGAKALREQEEQALLEQKRCWSKRCGTTAGRALRFRGTSYQCPYTPPVELIRLNGGLARPVRARSGGGTDRICMRARACCAFSCIRRRADSGRGEASPEAVVPKHVVPELVLRDPPPLNSRVTGGPPPPPSIYLDTPPHSPLRSALSPHLPAPGPQPPPRPPP